MAAGSWVDWNTGDLVTAAAFQDIQDSIVFIYSSEAAANAALTNKVKGTIFFDTTANVLKAWDGVSAWISAETGDISAVTAGNGLSGGGSSGDVTLDLDLNELTGATVDVANDSIAIVDATDNSSKKESIADLVSGIAGTGLTATAGVLSAAGGGITEADVWRLTTTITNTTADITSGWERSDDPLAGYLGTGMSESSGIFTFPSTGIYLITIFSCGETAGQGTNFFILKGTTDNFSTEDTLARTDNDNQNGSTVNYNSSVQVIVDITDTTNQKVKFSTSQSGAGASIIGDTDFNRSGATFVRLGDT